MRLGLSAGCDALGMSTAYEVIAARHAGMKCFAVSLITNLCQPNYNQGRFHFELGHISNLILFPSDL